MRCPYYRPPFVSGSAPLCLGAVVPFEPSERDQDFCATDRHRWCPLYRNATRDCVTAARPDVA
jgi:hypothetical protein